MKINKKGFSLVEILLVMTLISILVATVILAINPSRQLAKSNNLERETDINEILSAISSFALDNQGKIPENITDQPEIIGTNPGEVDFCDDLVPIYLAEIPFDPINSDAYFNDCGDYSSQYEISVDANGRITITAPFAQLGEIIEAQD